MFEIDFEFYRYAFCVVIGAAFGIIFLVYKVMSGSMGMLSSIADRNEYDQVKILSGWNIGFAAVTMILVFMFFSGREGSAVNVLLRDSWDYLASQGLTV